MGYKKEDLVEIINQTYPDIRKTLNLLQSSIKQGNLVLNQNIVNQQQYTKQIIDLIKQNDSKSFNQIRQIVANSNIRDYNELYRALFDNLDSFSNPILGTAVIAESQYQSALAPDKEICFMGCIAKLLK